MVSLNLTLEAAAHILGPEFDAEDPLDPTFQKHWLSGAERVACSDEKRRDLWARLLAGEIQHPGSFSLRTMNLMDNMSSSEAKLFQQLGVCLWKLQGERFELLIPRSKERKYWNLTYTEIATLEHAGLVSVSALGFGKDLEPGRFVVSTYHDFTIALVPKETSRLATSPVRLTPAGDELAKLVDCDPDLEYRQEIIENYKMHGKVHEVNYSPDGLGNLVFGREL